LLAAGARVAPLVGLCGDSIFLRQRKAWEFAGAAIVLWVEPGTPSSAALAAEQSPETGLPGNCNHTQYSTSKLSVAFACIVGSIVVELTGAEKQRDAACFVLRYYNF